MTASPYRADPLPPTHEGEFVPVGAEDTAPAFDQAQWSESLDERGNAGAGGRAVLGWALGALALGWTAYAFWSAGRAIDAGSLSSPALAQWVAIAAGPLALMGLVWLMFGRTRRKEAERFTRSVIAMRTEARALQDILGALSQQIEQNHEALGLMAGDLMGLGDQAASRLGSVTANLNAGSRALADHGAALDRAAESARLDLGVLLSDLPLAEQSAARMAESLRGAGQSARQEAAKYERQVAELHETTRDTDAMVHDAAQRLVAHLTHIEGAGAAAAAQIGEAGLASGETVNALLMRASDALDQIRSGIDGQAAAVSALVEQASAGLGRAGMEASEAIDARLSSANGALESLSARIAEQDAASQRMVGDLDAGLAALDQRFATLAEAGDERAARVQGTIGQLRGDLEALGGETQAHDAAIDALAERTQILRAGVGELAHSVATELAASLGEAEGGAARLQAAIEQARPTLGWMRDASAETSERIEAGAAGIEEQHERLAALLAAVDTGVGGAASRSCCWRPSTRALAVPSGV